MMHTVHIAHCTCAHCTAQMGVSKTLGGTPSRNSRRPPGTQVPADLIKQSSSGNALLLCSLMTSTRADQVGDT